MLPERYRQLLTAYVDGEISARQRRMLQKLLRRSPEARKLLKQMQSDSHELRALPPARLEQDLSDSVLTLIAQRQIQPPRPRVAPPEALPVVPAVFWPYLAAAAAILLAVGGVSYLFFASSFEPVKTTGPVAKEEHKAPSNTKPDPSVGSGNNTVEKPSSDKSDDTPRPKPEDKPNPPAVVVKDKPPKPQDDPKPPPGMDDALTAPSMELFDLKKADVALPVVLKLHQLDQDAKRKVLLDELQKAKSFHLELPCANGTKSFERVQAACKAENITVLIEQTAQERLKKSQLKTNYVVYIEDVTPEELTRWLQRLATEDSKAENKKQAEPQLGALVLTQMTKQDRDELSKLLITGATPVQPKGPSGTDPGKPVSEKMAEQVAEAMAGQGGAPPAATVPKTGAKTPQQTALVLAYNPVRPNPKAPEIKRWLDTRKQPRKDTLQILLVLRSTNG